MSKPSLLEDITALCTCNLQSEESCQTLDISLWRKGKRSNGSPDRIPIFRIRTKDSGEFRRSPADWRRKVEMRILRHGAKKPEHVVAMLVQVFRTDRCRVSLSVGQQVQVGGALEDNKRLDSQARNTQ